MRTYRGKSSVHTPRRTPLSSAINDFDLFPLSRTSGPSVAGLETTYSGGNGFSTSYNSQRWLNLYLSACKLLDLALALPPESLPQFQMWVQETLMGEENTRTLSPKTKDNNYNDQAVELLDALVVGLFYRKQT